ncbi:MAG: hypothetical protein IJI14_02960 [Anaerolineaceae bacterium]|nr:hypothetical protein [Anaerolineaceae bacterium]
MKNLKLFIFVLALALCLSVSAFAEDTHFTCESDINDFNGKTFDNLYLDLVSCGENVEFTDLTVTGNLVYNGGRDTVDHNLKFVHPSIQSMFVPCESTHNCTISFVPSEDIEYVVSEMTVMPSGSEKGKVVLWGEGKRTLGKTFSWGYETDERYMTEIDRLNYIPSILTEEFAASLRNPDNIPAEFSGPSVPAGLNELEINHIKVMEMSVVNSNKEVIPAVTSNSRYEIDLLAVYSPTLKLYGKNADEYRSPISSMITAVNGEEFDLSVDKVGVGILHFHGNNNKESVLRVVAGAENLHEKENVIKNLYLFGSNLEYMGYGKPNKRIMNTYRVIITEQPQEYKLQPSPAILNDFFANYGPEHAIDPIYSEDKGDWKEFNKYKYDVDYYEGLLDMNAIFPSAYLRLVSDLSWPYAINYPDSDAHWQPYINLSYANIGKAICAKSIADEVGPYQMIHINHESYMNTQADVMRYVMPEGLTQSLAEEPKVTTQTQLDDLFDGLEDGCYVFNFDQYGRPYLVE